MLIYYCLKRRKETEAFDGNFDPDRLDPERFGGSATRPGILPIVDLDVAGGEITPFTRQNQADPLPEKNYDPYAQMGQQPGMVMVSGEGSGRRRSEMQSSSSGSHYPTTVTGQSVTGMHPVEFRGPSPGPSLGTSGTLPSSKDSEARRLQIANSGNAEGRFSQSSSSGILQHRDAGQLQQQPVPEEIPPSYDSIPAGETQRHSVSFRVSLFSTTLIVLPPYTLGLKTDGTRRPVPHDHDLTWRPHPLKTNDKLDVP